MDAEFYSYWRRLSRTFDPYYAIPVEDVGALYAPRYKSPSERLSERIRSDERPEQLKVLLCGARGSGKSTELARLAELLFLEWAPLRLDLAAVLPPGSATLPICVHIGAAALRALHDRKNPGAPLTAPGAGWTRAGALFSGALQALGVGAEALSKLLEAAPAISQLVLPPSAEVAVPAEAVPTIAAGAGAIARAADSQLRARMNAARAAVSGPLGEYVSADKMDDAQRVLDGVNGILDELKAHEQRPVLVLVEGLDKLQQLSDVQLALSQPELLEQLQAPLVMTGPMQLRSSPHFSRLPGTLRPEPLSNVPILSPPFTRPTPNPAGIREMVDIFIRRRAHFQVAEDIISDKLLDQAALMSSGTPREFLTLLELAKLEAISARRRHIAEADLEGSLKQRRQELTGAFTSERVRILFDVLSSGTASHGELADELLFTNFIAAYPNGDLWYRPHELLVESVRERGALLERAGR